MGYIAEWGPRGFVATAYKILPIMDFSTSKSVKSEAQSDSNATSQTVLKGAEPYSISISTVCLRAAGVDPRKQVEEWEEQLGNAYPLYIGGERFGPKKMYLKKVDSSDYKFNNSGTIVSLSMDLEFEEFVEPVTKTTVQSGATSNAKKTALNSTASSTERANRKPSVRKEMVTME